MKHFLVPVDFSDYAINAARYAVRIASCFSAKITLFHTYHIPIIDPLMPSDYISELAESAEKDVASHMQQLVEKLNQFASQYQVNPVEIHSSVTMGFAVDEILLAIEKLTPDMVIMGRRYTEGMTKILLGSITSSIIEKSSVPVLVVPENTSPEDAFKDILYATEFDEADSRAITRLLTFTEALHVKVHCIHIVTGEDPFVQDKLKALEKQFDSYQSKGLIEFRNISSETVLSGLLDYAARNNIGMVAMLTHKRSFFQKLFDRSLTKEAAFKSNLPLLAFHDEA
ncbi:MAG: universal stress protein [Chitinophagales bacterium]|nr:MAG: universal stress protein [Chitinophagales bacterium]